jgi:hypothetical protein
MTTRSQESLFETENALTSVESLLHELDTVGRPAALARTDGDEIPDDPASAALTVALQKLVEADGFQFDEGMVKQNLEEVLVTLVALQEQGTHGKSLMNDLSTLFDADLSPGTVYPSLHDLSDEEVLRVHEMVRTKEYRVDDEDCAREMVHEAMLQHLALGMFFHETLQRM